MNSDEIKAKDELQNAAYGGTEYETQGTEYYMWNGEHGVRNTEYRVHSKVYIYTIDQDSIQSS